MQSNKRRIGIVGAGIQGCSIAMELASQGLDVVLMDAARQPMSRASRWNEGKIHLGYVYALDDSMKTAKLMVDGAFDFLDFFKKHLGDSLHLGLSSAFTYLVKNESMVSPEDAASYFKKVDGLVWAEIGKGRNYLGVDSLTKTERLEELPQGVALGEFLAAFQTPELSIDIQTLASKIEAWVENNPLVTVQCGTRVKQICRTNDGAFRCLGADGQLVGEFDDIVNASWESRLKLDESVGISTPSRKWLHRYKVSVILRTPGLEVLPSVTMMLGKFGDIVNFQNGNYYLNWYPVGKFGESDQIEAPSFECQLTAEVKAEIAASTIRELSELFPPLRSLEFEDSDISVEGGYIFAWGDKDVDQNETDLHQRFDTGVTSYGRFHSVDTGKLTTSTLFARDCAARISS